MIITVIVIVLRRYFGFLIIGMCLFEIDFVEYQNVQNGTASESFF